jgi:hypothetical protein
LFRNPITIQNRVYNNGAGDSNGKSYLHMSKSSDLVGKGEPPKTLQQLWISESPIHNVLKLHRLV